MLLINAHAASKLPLQLAAAAAATSDVATSFTLTAPRPLRPLSVSVPPLFSISLRTTIRSMYHVHARDY